MCQIVLKLQSTLEETQSFSQINTASQLIIKYRCGLFCIDPKFGTFYFLTPPLYKGIVSGLELAIVTNKVAL